MPNSRNLKPLGIANCIDDLNSHAMNLKVAITTDIQCMRYCIECVEIFRDAETEYQEGDEERAYVLFMRLLCIFERVGRTPVYQRRKREYNDIINIKNIKKAGERVEELLQSLEERYLQRDLERIVSGLANRDREADARGDLNERPLVDPVQERNVENGQLAAQSDTIADDDAEDHFPADSPPHGGAYCAVGQCPSTSQLYFPVLASILATSESTYCYAGLPPPLSPEQYRLGFRRTDDTDDRNYGPQEEFLNPRFRYSCSLVHSCDTDMEKGEFTVARKMETAKDLQDVKLELDHLLIDSEADTE